MQRSAAIVLTVLIALLALFWLTGLVSAGRSPAPTAPLAGAPSVVSYQGQVSVGGTPYTGTGYFKFAVVDTTPTTHWSNDGTSSSGGAPTNAVQLTVSNGLFGVLLGDTTLTHMTALSAAAFSGTERYLRVWFSNDGSAFTQLSPDRRIAAVPYALQAEEVKNAWALTGNAGATPGTNFLGTTDNVALELHVNSRRALRLEPGSASPNLIGGYSDNWLTNGVFGATIGGGGSADRLNRVTDAFGTVGGGRNNQAGYDDDNPENNLFATVGGGSANTAAGAWATVGGGSANTAEGAWATVGGGDSNSASGDYSAAAGRRAKALHEGTFVWADSTDTDFASTTDNQFAVRATGGVSFTTGSAAVQVNGNTVWHAGDDGAGSGLDADFLDGQQGTYYQARVSGTCSVGSTARAINWDGTVVCQVDAPLNRPSQPLANTRTRLLTSANDFGHYTSITIGADGLGLISHHDYHYRDLTVAHCNDAVCSNASLATLDSAGDVGWYTSITIGADGLGLISYYDATNGALKVAHCNNATCSSADLATLDRAVTLFTSITIGGDGLGLISYRDDIYGDLKVAHCNDAACSGASLATLDSAGDVGGYTSITLGADGLGLISYFDATLRDLKVAHCNNTVCSSASLATLDGAGDVGYATSITIGADGLGLISYYDGTNRDLKVAHCNNAACSSASLATLDSAGDAGAYNSITIGADGLGLISYYEGISRDLKIAHCNNTACSSASLATLDSAGDAGLYAAITIGADGLGLISYHDNTNNHLMILHCANAFCTPYFRRR